VVYVEGLDTMPEHVLGHKIAPKEFKIGKLYSSPDCFLLYPHKNNLHADHYSNSEEIFMFLRLETVGKHSIINALFGEEVVWFPYSVYIIYNKEF